jgi:peptidoglycan/LPS O-acetylase OafA/YrhL
MVYTSLGKGEKFASKEFLLRRFLRIYPIYWVYAALYLADQPNYPTELFISEAGSSPKPSPASWILVFNHRPWLDLIL